MQGTLPQEDKIKVMVISDHPLSPSGVGTQTLYMIDNLLKTGRFKFYCLGGAIDHRSFKPLAVDPWGEDFIIQPVKGYGNQEQVRQALKAERPDMLWFMTDPRFYEWLWAIDDEIRSVVPMVYYHVWDNKPYPTFNKPLYDSNDVIATISKVTDDIVRNVSPDVETHYVPHSVNTDIFKPMSEAERFKQRVQNFGPEFGPDSDKMLFFWNNRNAKRKQSGSVIWWFKEFLKRVGEDKAMLLMHTDVHDQYGQDLLAIGDHLGMLNGQLKFSEQKVPPEMIALFCNMADCTINIADAEGFGLGTLESLSCGTPIVVNMTGGLQEQVTDGEEWFGIGIEPSSKAVIGSQPVPWIYEDRVDEEDVVNALVEMYEMGREKRLALGAKGREHVLKNYNFETYRNNWFNLLTKVHEKHGSWDTRKNYEPWTLKKIDISGD
tara:strand:+ start:484 stop:1785 length:1302 start_codon:yes stop_codon:yes gene_type:complete